MGDFLVLLPAGRPSIMPVMDEPLPAAVQPAEEPLQFSLRAIMIAQAVCALFCGLFVMAGIFALLAAFVVTLIYCWVGVRPENARLKRFIVDLLGGVVLPVLCVVYDPIIFRGSGGGPLGGLQPLAYLIILFQMCVLLVWLIGYPWLGRGSAVFAGILWVGSVTAFGIGGITLPLSLLGLLAAFIGLLGFTPFLTGIVFGRNAAQADRRARVAGGRALASWLTFLGAMLAVAIPGLVYLSLGTFIEVAIQWMPQPGARLFPGW